MDLSEKIETYYLFPSSIYTSVTPCQVTTVLGSCVSIFLYDVSRKIGGINHYMLPLWNGSGLASPKYGNIAIERLIDKMLQIGCDKDNLIAKIFGGANVLETTTSIFNVGERNYLLALEMIEKENIRIAAKSIGGDKGRKLIFNTYTGEVMLKFLNKITS